MARNIAKALVGHLGIVPATISASADGTGIDCSGHEQVLYVAHVGAVNTFTSMDLKIQESATVGGTYTDCPGGGFTQVLAANNVEAVSVKVNPSKPFQRTSLTLVGTSFVGGVSRFKAYPTLLPASSLAT